MKHIHYKIVILYLFLQLITASNNIFVAPDSTCGTNCDGSITNPYLNLFDALKNVALSSSADILLLFSSSTPHYILDKSTSTGVQFEVTNLVIRPLFCNEAIASSLPLSGKCLQQGEKITVYMKTTEFTISSNGILSIENIIFDAVEDIKHLNTASTQLTDCISNRKRCCKEGTKVSTLYPDTLVCLWSGDYSSLSLAPSTSLFMVTTSTGSSSSGLSSLTFKESGFKNFLSPHIKSLVKIKKTQLFSLIFNQSNIDSVYFDSGLILYQTDSPGTTSRTNNSYVTIEDTSFTNYNPWNLLLQDSTRTEGYLVNTKNLFSGVIQIQNSTFANFTSSLRDKCWPQTSTYYTLPMNNLLTTNPRSRSDLWSQYNGNRGAKDFVSSLIHITQIYGAVSISSTTFTNIIGTSGSVLRVDDVISSDTWFTFYNSTFDATFAYDSFANIMIAKSSDPHFYSMLECPHVEMAGSKFVNTYGCPGSYGNTFFLCYWDTNPSQSSLSSYSLSTKASELSAAWTSDDVSRSTIRVTDCEFTNNLLSVSNSLAIIGSSYTILEENTFENNGGTTAEVAKYSLEGSYYLNRYPKGVVFPLEMTHFGQSTVVYFDHVVKITSRNNIYKGNWGPWEGSLALATTLTVKNWIKISDGITLSGDIFEGHQGIPSEIASYLTNTGLASNSYMEPLISVSLDTIGSTKISASLPALNINQYMAVDLTNVTFDNNLMNYDYTSYNYNPTELSPLFSDIIPLDARYQSGLAKLLWVSEAVDDLSYGFKSEVITATNTNFAFQGGKISNNDLQSMGCFFKDVSLVEDTTISGNNIYVAQEGYYLSIGMQSAYIMPTDGSNQGVFCVGTIQFPSAPF